MYLPDQKMGQQPTCRYKSENPIRYQIQSEEVHQSQEKGLNMSQNKRFSNKIRILQFRVDSSTDNI